MEMTAERLATWVGQDAVDREGDKIGTIVDVYADDDTGQAEWLAVKTGWFGKRVSFVPLAGASEHGDGLRVAWDTDRVKDAPSVDPDGHLTPEDEDRLYDHYELGALGADVRGDADVDTTAAGRADDAMTRSEEELRVGRERREAGRARLRKWVDTEHVATTVPVERETVRVEREPVTGDNVDAALSGPDISEAEHEVVLHEERAVADTEVVPKERVRMAKDTVVDEDVVEADVRKERIDVEGAGGELGDHDDEGLHGEGRR